MDPAIKKAARAILMVFHDRKVGAGGFLNYADFGKTLRWEAGFVKHENQREALRFLVDNGYVVELNSGLELTSKGAATLERA